MANSHQENDIDLWYTRIATISDPQLLEAYRALLTPEEVQRAQRFVFDRHRDQYLITRALVRTTLSRYADVEPRDWEFQQDRYGKPHVAGPVTLPLAFNLSHTDGLVICGVAAVSMLGVDVERIDRATEALSIARRFFARPEVEYLASANEPDRRATFFQIWTLKEAYIKARGEGLSIPLADFAFQFRSNEPVSIRFLKSLEDDAQRWQFFQLEANPYRIAIAARQASAESLRLCICDTIPLQETGPKRSLDLEHGVAGVSL
jgi:4'-phosphopantetheinyl transferase